MGSLDMFINLSDLSLFHLSSSTYPKSQLASSIAASAFKYCDWMKVLAGSLQVGFRNEWKRALALFKCTDIVQQ